MSSIPAPFAETNRRLRHRLGAALAIGILGLVAILFLHQSGANMAASTGMPFWDDWGYFFGDHIGVQLPLTLKTIFAKDADHIAPVFKLVTYALWQISGMDLLVFRLFGWVCFGTLLVAYAGFLVTATRAARGFSWGTAAALAPFIVLMSTMNQEFFYFQNIGFSQPVFYVFLFSFCGALAWGWTAAACVALILFGSTGVFGVSYVLGLVGCALAVALVQAPRSPLAFLRKRKLLVPVALGLAVAAGICLVTFQGSYLNHTRQALVPPWEADLWVFVLGAFGAAFGYQGEPGAAPLQGGIILALYALPLLGLLRPGKKPDTTDIVIGGLIAATLLVTIVTAAGRTHLCGGAFSQIVACGQTARYVYPVLLALPAVIVGWLRLVPLPVIPRRTVIGAVLAALAAANLIGRDGVPSLDRWRVAGLNAMTVDRDHIAQACLQDYLQAVLPSRANRDEPVGWDVPLTCPNTSPRNLNRFLHAAYEQKAAFLAPLLTARPSERQELARALLRSGRLDTDGTGRHPVPAAPGTVAGWIDTLARLKDGTPALRGWAVDLERHDPLAFVLLVVGERVVAIGGTGGDRPDVGRHFADDRLTASGFMVPIPPGLLAEGGAGLRVFAVTRSLTMAELAPAGGVDAGPLRHLEADAAMPAAGP